MAAEPTLATAHADAAEGFGAVDFLAVELAHAAPQFTDGHGFAAADHSLVGQRCGLRMRPREGARQSCAERSG